MVLSSVSVAGALVGEAVIVSGCGIATVLEDPASADSTLLAPGAVASSEVGATDGSSSSIGGSGFGMNTVFLTSRLPRMLPARRFTPDVCAC